MSSEHQRIARLAELLRRESVDVSLGIGDDCAVLSASSAPQVWTVDAAVEGVHFRRDLMTLDAIGYRAFMAAASDIAAMGARARAALSALVLPPTLRDQELEELVLGLRRAADRCACPIAGGNLARGGELSLTTSVLGEPHGRVIERRGARPGDRIYVSGPLGGAALGLRALAQGESGSEVEPFVRAFLEPRARFDIAARLSHAATSAIDISDGLLQDLMHVCVASGVAARLELAAVPRLGDFDAVASALGADGVQALLAGGEDYELLFTAAPELACDWATPIGHVVGGTPEVSVWDRGLRLDLKASGFDHFR